MKLKNIFCFFKHDWVYSEFTMFQFSFSRTRSQEPIIRTCLRCGREERKEWDGYTDWWYRIK